MPSRSHAITGPAKHAVSQLRDLPGLGFTGFNFKVSGPDRKARRLPRRRIFHAEMHDGLTDRPHDLTEVRQ